MSALKRDVRTARRLRIDALLRVSVVSGGVLVLVAIASIFLFLVWETLPIFRQSLSVAEPVQVEYPKDGSPPIQITSNPAKLVSLEGAISAYLKENDPSQWAADELSEAPHSEVSLTLSTRDNSLVAMSHRDGHLALYDRVDWGKPRPFFDKLVGEARFDFAPDVSELYSSSLGKLHVVVRNDTQLYWYEASPLVSAPGTFQLNRSVELGTAADFVHILGDGRWMLLLNRSGHYRLVSAGPSGPDWSGELRNTDNIRKTIALRSGYGLVVLAGPDQAHHLGLTYEAGRPVLVETNAWSTVYSPKQLLLGQNRHLFLIGAENEVEVYNSGTFSRSLVPAGERIANHWLVSPNGDLVGVNNNEAFALDPTLTTVSLLTLFGSQVHEGYSQADWLWQSTGVEPTSAPKYSITPLLLGSLKAALYALIIAVPLAVSAALFTAHFMSEGLRARVKPVLESLAALPTVVLGLIAGLWFAPWLEQHFIEFVISLLLLPLSLVLASMLWRLSPAGRGESRLTGSELLLAAVFMLASLALAQAVAPTVSSWLMPEGLVSYLADAWGLQYEQRNAFIVAFILGLALVPTVYTISEDALFAVPIQLREGALALGATEWQAARSVILPAAAPGILSAIMMGMARGVGETMIVLMATGNTPLMDANVFTGMRTLSATLAMEMPEVSPDTQHFHILMFIALQLFVFTFAINTVAEWIRSRLLRRMESL